MATGTITWEEVEHTGWIWIDRPHKRNAMTDAMWGTLSDILAQASHTGVRSVVIAGRGGTFLAGADILEFESTKATPEAAMDSFRSVDSACRAVQEVAMPIIAAIEGYAVGAGLELAAACDFRLASTTARLGITAAKLAITPGRGHITRLRNVIGTAHSLDLLLTGRLVSANEAYAMGLVTEVVPSEDSVLSRAQALGETLASRAPGSLRWIKQTIYGAQGTLTDDPDADAQEATQCFATEDFREAVQAFRGKRPPVFTGH